MNFDELVKQEFLKKASGTILNNLSMDQFEVSEMAREMGMSRSNLYRKIRSSAGMSPSEYIRKVKLGRAMELLQESTASVTEIAFECGFQSLSYFDTCFKKQFGNAPSKIRRHIHQSTDGPIEREGEHLPFSSHERSKDAGSKIHNFPVPVTTFIGRQKEIRGILGLLKTSRIVSLVGPGGCGKTRLATEVVSYLENGFSDGIWFVDLSPVEPGELVAKEIMDTLQIPENPNAGLLEILSSRLKGRKLMMVLDNCEHLVDHVAEIAGKLSLALPGLKILVTSRTALNIPGETVWRIPSLSLKDPGKIKRVEEAEESEAILLFADRARMSDQRFRLSENNIRDVAVICKHVDGIPLAVELVASRIRYLDPGNILERFANRFSDLTSSDPGTTDRHQTMNATIEWSYKLLTDEEKTLFKRMSVFSGGFQLEAVEEVCIDPSIPGEYVIDLIGNLVDHSMILTIRDREQPLRYNLLEPIKHYAARLLGEREGMRTKRRHVKYFIGIAEEAYRERLTLQTYWMSRLALEQDNMMAALNWAEKHHFNLYSKLLGLLAWFWARSNHLLLARQKLGNLINDRRIKNETRARILIGYGWSLASQVEMYASLGELLKEAFAIWRRLGNLEEEVILRTDTAALYFGTGNDETAVQTIMETYELAQKLDNRGVLLYCLMYVSMGHVVSRRFDEARRTIVKMLALAEELENIFAQFAGHHNLGDCALMEGKFEEAEQEYGEGIKITMKFRDMHYLYTDLAGVAMAVAGMGRHIKALRLMGGINANAKRAGIMSPEYSQISFWKEQMKLHIEGTREKLGEVRTRKYEAEGAMMELEEVVDYALDFDRD